MASRFLGCDSHTRSQSSVFCAHSHSSHTQSTQSNHLVRSRISAVLQILGVLDDWLFFIFFCHGNQGQRVVFSVFPYTMHQQEVNNAAICSGYAKRYVYITVHTGGNMEISLRTEKPQRNEPTEQCLREVIQHRYGREWEISMLVIST